MDKEILENTPEIPKEEKSSAKEVKASNKRTVQESAGKDESETIFIPKGGRNEENFVIVTINGKRWKIQRGVSVEVPKCVAEVYKHSLAQQASADEYLDSIENNNAR